MQESNQSNHLEWEQQVRRLSDIWVSKLKAVSKRADRVEAMEEYSTPGLTLRIRRIFPMQILLLI